MTKGELKTGMVVETPGGSKALVLLGTEHGDILSGEIWCPLSKYSEDLRFKGYDDGSFIEVMQIDRIYQPSNNSSFQKMDVNELDDLIWERPKRVIDYVTAIKKLSELYGEPVVILKGGL